MSADKPVAAPDDYRSADAWADWLIERAEEARLNPDRFPSSAVVLSNASARQMASLLRSDRG